MIHLMFQKLMHKKWMMLSLALGNILLIAIAASYPMFRDASLARMLSDEFVAYIDNNNVNPAIISITGKTRKRQTTEGYDFARAKADTALQDIGLEGGLLLKFDTLIPTEAVSNIDRQETSTKGQYCIASLEGLEDNCKVVSGEMFSDEIHDGIIDAVVTVSGFVNMDVLIGEELEFSYITDMNGNPIKIHITGVINSTDNVDYWIKPESDYTRELLISSKIFGELFIANYSAYDINSTWHLGFDYTKIEYSDVSRIMLGIRNISINIPGNIEVVEPRCMNFLGTYLVKEKKIEATLIILQIPVLVLLCAFIYMIAGQMYSMEQNEIALMRSRGAGKGQIFRLYLMQSVFMAAVGAAGGLPLGSLLCRALGSASAFLEFEGRRYLNVRFTSNVFIYAGAAVVLSILMSVLPSVIYSKKTIVKSKVSKARKVRPLWQKLFFDVILLAVSIYGYYNFSRQREALEIQVLEGQALDPLLYLSSSLFILGAALLMLRVIPFIVSIVYLIGKKKWSPAIYSSFKEILRSGSSRYFIMTFLILTVALGIFNTTVARTIASNNENNLAYQNGAQMAFVEAWSSNFSSVAMDPSIPLVYKEPDFSKYEMIEGVEKTAKVYINNKAVFDKDIPVKVMGINTKEFGEVTELPRGLLPRHYYNYLNELSVDVDYALVSSSFRDIMGYQIGDKISYRVEGNLINAKIIDFVDYFPSFNPTKTAYNADGSAYSENNYLIVAHLSTIQKKVGLRPYYVWMKFEEGAGTDAFYQYVADNNIKISAYSDLDEKVENVKTDTLFQGTNGILTLSFMVILVLCFIGYLIYWTLTMSSRELLLGILRAMGMSKNEVFAMLINEQLYSSILPLGAGIGIGILASKLYVPLIQIAYSASNQALPLKLVTQSSDMLQLAIIISIMLIFCLIILARQIFRMKIAQALKLGED